MIIFTFKSTDALNLTDYFEKNTYFNSFEKFSTIEFFNFFFSYISIFMVFFYSVKNILLYSVNSNENILTLFVILKYSLILTSLISYGNYLKFLIDQDKITQINFFIYYIFLQFLIISLIDKPKSIFIYFLNLLVIISFFNLFNVTSDEGFNNNIKDNIIKNNKIFNFIIRFTALLIFIILIIHICNINIQTL